MINQKAHIARAALVHAALMHVANTYNLEIGEDEGGTFFDKANLIAHRLRKKQNDQSVVDMIVESVKMRMELTDLLRQEDSAADDHPVMVMADKIFLRFGLY